MFKHHLEDKVYVLNNGKISMGKIVARKIVETVDAYARTELGRAGIYYSVLCDKLIGPEIFAEEKVFLTPEELIQYVSE